jgi:hypothetical protein
MQSLLTQLRHRQSHGEKISTIGDPVDADELFVKQSHKPFSESFQAQEQVGRFRQKHE